VCLCSHSKSIAAWRGRFATIAVWIVFAPDAVPLHLPLHRPASAVPSRRWNSPERASRFYFQSQFEASFAIFPLCLCALLVLFSAAPLPPPARNRIFHSPISLSLSFSSSSRVRSSQETRTMFARDRPFKSRFIPGIRLEIARNFVETVSSGLSCLQRLARSPTMLRNWNFTAHGSSRFYRRIL